MSFWNLFKNKKLKELEEAVSKNPLDPKVHFELGNELELAGKYQEAIKSFKETIRLHPTSAEAHFNLGILFAQLEDGREAIKHMVQAGNLFSQRKNTSDQEKARKKLRELHNKFPEALKKNEPKNSP